VAACAHSNRSDGHAPAGAEVTIKLTLELDHLRGADHWYGADIAAALIMSALCLSLNL